MNRNSGNVFEIGMLGLLLFAVVVILIIGVFSPVNAQDEHVITVFQVTCLEPLSEDHYRLHIHYTSDGLEAFTFAMGDVIGANGDTLPYVGHATTNIPDTFITSIGSYDDWYLEAHSEDSPYTFTLLFTNDIGTGVLLVNTWDNMPECDSLPLNAPETAQMPTGALNTMPLAQPVVSTGRTCTVKYPQLVVVCN